MLLGGLNHVRWERKLWGPSSQSRGLFAERNWVFLAACFCSFGFTSGWAHHSQVPQRQPDQPVLTPQDPLLICPGRGCGHSLRAPGGEAAWKSQWLKVIGRGSLEAVSQILVVWHLIQQYYLNTAESWRVQDSFAKEMALIPKQSKKRPQTGC